MSERVRVFLDTSVLIAASDMDHARHAESRVLLAAASKENCACGAHSLAESYANLSIVRGGGTRRPETALRLVEQIASRMMVVALEPDEYLEAIRDAAGLRISGGTIYDALLVKCALKVDAERIYTWNERHLRLVAPELAGRIVRP